MVSLYVPGRKRPCLMAALGVLHPMASDRQRLCLNGGCQTTARPNGRRRLEAAGSCRLSWGRTRMAVPDRSRHGVMAAARERLGLLAAEPPPCGPAGSA